MTVAQRSATRTALEPVRAELLRRAADDAARIRAAAAADARRMLADARAEAERTRRAARADGEAAALAARTADRARTRRAERARQLAARQEAYAELRARATAAVTRLRDDPELVASLRSAARALLGPDAVVTEAPEGGVVAEAAGRRLDLTLPTLAARATDRLGPEVETLWLT